MSTTSPSVDPFLGLRRRAPGESSLDDARSVRRDAFKKEQGAREQRPAYFEKSEYAALDVKLSALANAGHFWARDARIILKQDPITRRSGFIGLAPRPSLARELAFGLRRVNAFCVGLERLYEMAGIAMPTGSFAEITPNQLSEAITKLQAPDAPAGIDAPAVVEVLQSARIARGMARVFVDGSNVTAVADALHAVGASKFVVNRLDTIAGRAGFRRAA